MKIQEIYDGALRLAGEISLSGANEDYEERAPYLTAIICHRYGHLDRLYRKAHGLEEQNLLSLTKFPFPATFPLSDCFVYPISLHLAALLVLEENPDLSQHLTDMADHAVEEIRHSIPFCKEEIISHYAI